MAKISLATFAQTVNAGVPYHVFLTAEGDCKGLYVSNKTVHGSEVHELGGGGASNQVGLPLDVFSSGAAETARVLLVGTQNNRESREVSGVSCRLARYGSSDY